MCVVCVAFVSCRVLCAFVEMVVRMCVESVCVRGMCVLCFVLWCAVLCRCVWVLLLVLVCNVCVVCGV